jgi:hypothetical protein
LKKRSKKLLRLRCFSLRVTKGTKVFWFFFSKKNVLPSFDTYDFGRRAWPPSRFRGVDMKAAWPYGVTL